MHKNLLFTVLCLFLFLGAFAQNSQEVEFAKAELTKQAERYGLDRTQIEDFIVSDHYVTAHNQASHLYLVQTHKSVPVYNGVITIGIKDNKIYNIASNAVKNLEDFAIVSTPALTPDQAIQAAGDRLGFPNNETFQRIGTKGANSYVYAASSFASNKIPVFLCYDKNADGNYILTWNVDLDIPGSDYFSVRVDATTGDIVSKNNYTLYCKFNKNASHNHDNACRTSGSKVAKKASNKTNTKIVSSMLIEESMYRVYPAPAESPEHGEHEIVTNPYDDQASPFGWHDTDGVDGAEFTITQGNNVHAYLDKNIDDISDGSEPDGGAELIFDFAHDKTLEPADSEQAAQVNLFYMNNFLHDFLYRHGFDEAGGNFQENNYGNGGQGGDYVFAESADGSGTNNANFGTPPDGGSGRMQMFLWGASEFDLFTVNSPEQIEGKYDVRAAGFGGAITDTPVTGDLVFVNDGSTEPTTGCSNLTNPDEIDGKIAVVDRGLCEFGAKALFAENAGAIAAVVCNIPGVNGGDGSEIFAMGAGLDGGSVTIPVIMMTFQDCNKIRASMDAGIVVTSTLQQPQVVGPMNLDASYDNGVIAHELGHGVSNRVTGGPGMAGCLSNDEQMGEGWSDFFALVTSVEPGDAGDDARGIGTYVLNEPTTGAGIRDFRYSTDIDVSPKTYSDIIGTGAPHPLGEVWAALTWDLYWAMVDKYGYDADVNNQESGNAKAIRLVIDGMREQGCNPGFVSGRQGIIAADNVNNDGENNCLIWEVFARRGVGFFADEVSTNDRNDGVENFEPRPTCLEELKIKKIATPFVEAGDNIEYTITITNHRPELITGVVVNDMISAGTSYNVGSSNMTEVVSGDMISWELGDMEYEDVITITYSATADAGVSSTTYIYDDMEDGEDNWDIAINEGTSVIWELIDEAASSGTDAWYIPNASDEETDNELFWIDYFEVQGDRPTLKFNHRYNTETGSDGGFVSIQEEGQINWTRLNFDNNVLNGFNTTLAYGTFAIPSLAAFSGDSDGFVETYLDLTPWAGKKIRVQFRFGSDDNTAPVGDFVGWAVDDFELLDLKDFSGEACVMDDAGNSACSGTITLIESDLMVGNEGFEVDDYSMEIFPNPASEFVNVRFTASSSENANLTIMSVDGKVVSTRALTIQQGVDYIQLPVADLATGVYFVQLRGDNNNSIKRLIIE